ncbi:hypothetical protein B0O99DRAFT_652133 [Bisporella sp. PMI_857]|nr:hypothetical protein B0O99DRAFT_652133 [Bisporella sp. PMI_857]
MSIDKKESERDGEREGSDDSMDSTPEAETGAPQEVTGQVKRKGGRKPIYATSEERKQRNRQAQAAFRERRTEYIKQLEETIRVHETNLHNLQNAHRSAADECLMLRYKNSLLERILLEKGIDVQAELRAKTSSPHLGPTHMPPSMAQPPPMQRAIMNRHNQARRSNSNIAPKIEPGLSLQSPQLRPTPASHASSPTSNSPGFHNPGVLTPPASDNQAQLQQGHQPSRIHPARAQNPLGLPMNPGLVNTGIIGLGPGPKGQGINGTGSTANTPVTASFSPSFQNHIEQLGKLTQQEYDAQTDMIDDQDTSESGPGPYPENLFPSAQQQQLNYQVSQQRQQQLQQQQRLQQQQHSAQPQNHQMQGSSQAYSNSMTQLLDHDPLLEFDPFGLTASMQFPTQFSFDTSSMR